MEKLKQYSYRTMHQFELVCIAVILVIFLCIIWLRTFSSSLLKWTYVKLWDILQARKALSAMKGLVKLQAVIRGELVRRRLVAKLKCMLPFQMSKPRVYHIRVPTIEEYYESIERKLDSSPKGSVKSNELKVRGLISYNIYCCLSLQLNLNLYLFYSND